MRHKSAGLYFAFLAMSLAIAFANGEMLISQPNTLYSLGENINMQVLLDSVQTGYLEINLVCASGFVNLYHNVPESTSINLTRKLIPAYIGNLSGECYIQSAYDGDTKAGQKFTISPNIKVKFNTENLSINSGETLIIKGQAELENGKPVGENSAFVEVSINNITSGTAVINGVFEASFNIPTNQKKGNQIIEAKVYDVDSEGNRLNEGRAFTGVEILQVPAKLDIAIDKTRIIPGESIVLIPFIYDRAGDLFDEPLLVQIKTANQGIFQGTLEANKEFTLTTKTNDSYGEAVIIAQKNNLTYEKTFYIETLEKVGAEIRNSSLIITNIGNVPYKKIVEIQIGDKKILKELELGFGEHQEYKIAAPNGEYSISLKDDRSSEFSQSGVSLTGKAIRLYDAKNSLSNFFIQYPAVWIFIALVLIAFLIAIYRKYKFGKIFFLNSSEKYPYKGREFRSKPDSSHIEIAAPKSATIKNPLNVFANKPLEIGKDIGIAEPSSDLHGRKEMVCILDLKIKSNLAGIGEDYIQKAVNIAVSKKGAVYSSGNNIAIIFAPSITKTFKNEQNAIKTSQEIENVIKEHNRRFKDKIEYGLGINTGDLIVKVEEKLKFSSIGKTIVYAKKAAEIANNETIITSESRTKLDASIKVEKLQNTPLDLFRIKNISAENEEAKKFIQRFSRQN